MNTRWRKKSYRRLAVRILRNIRDHPIAGKHVSKFVVRSAAWQVRKRMTKRPRDLHLSSGYVLRCYPDSQSASNVIYFTELYDYNEMLFAARYLRPGDGAVDGGANIGTYSLLFAASVGATGRVDAFEPDEIAWRRLRENVELNALDAVVHSHKAALGDAEGMVMFTSDADVSNRVVSSVEPGRRATSVSVKMLSEYTAERRYALIKLDLEGYEHKALKGMKDALADANPPVILFEVVGHLLEKAGSSAGEVCAYVQRQGYELFTYEADTGLLSTADHLKGNLLAIHREALPDVKQRISYGGELALGHPGPRGRIPGRVPHAAARIGCDVAGRRRRDT